MQDGKGAPSAVWPVKALKPAVTFEEVHEEGAPSLSLTGTFRVTAVPHLDRHFLCLACKNNKHLQLGVCEHR